MLCIFLTGQYSVTKVSHLFSVSIEGNASEFMKAGTVAQRVKNLRAMKETWVQSLGWEDPLEEEMAAHSSILAWRIPWTEESGYSPRGRKEADVTEQPTH